MKRTPLKRSVKPIPKRRSKPRRGPLRCPEYRAWLKDNCLCVAGLAQGSESCSSWAICEAAHTKNNGMGSKGPNSSCAPLCRKHHLEYDRGRNAFEDKYRVLMTIEAAIHWRLFKETLA